MKRYNVKPVNVLCAKQLKHKVESVKNTFLNVIGVSMQSLKILWTYFLYSPHMNISYNRYIIGSHNKLIFSMQMRFYL